ncbi:MAG: metalloprotease family protein, partial [Thermofilum sp.]
MSAECRINVLEYLGAVLGLSVFMGVGWLYLLSLTGMSSLQSINYPFVPLVLAVVLTVVVHEGTHAVIAKILGAKKIKAGIFKYGAYVAVEDPLPRDKWVIVALAPLIISPITLLLAYLSGGIFRDTL